MARKTKLTGNAKKNHSAKEIAGASGKLIWEILTNERFGGVPTIVAIPPMEALYATPRSSPMEYFDTPSFLSNRQVLK